MSETIDVVAGDVIVRTIARLLTPFIQLFGLYIILHGHATPGGGFQGGVIIGSSFILIALAYGLPEAERRFSVKIRLIMKSVGVLFYALVGIICVLAGGYFLQYDVVPLPFPPQIVSGILISAIEVCIGITVLAAITIIFYTIAGGES